MPYIQMRYRTELDPSINDLIDTIRTIDISIHGHRLGAANYAITRILTGVFLRDVSYANLLAAIGTLEMTKQELYRRMAAPYEDSKRDESGEVYR